MREMQAAYSAENGQLLPLNDHSNAFGLGMHRRWFAQEGSYCGFKPGGFVGFFTQVFVLDKNHVVIMIAANQWSEKAFMGWPREFGPSLYRMID